jgi:hypothetical protein
MGMRRLGTNAHGQISYAAYWISAGPVTEGGWFRQIEWTCLMAVPTGRLMPWVERR